MWKWLKTSIQTIKLVVKYASLVAVIIGILGYSAGALEKWQEENQPPEVK